METKLILHRAYKGKYPENSLTAFRHAINEGFSTEIDICLTKDNAPVVIHDDNLKRLFNSNLKIKEHSFEELKKFHYLEDSNEKLPSLREFCETVKKEKNKESLVFIHIKELGDIDVTIKMIKEFGIERRMRFFAVDELVKNFIKLMRETYPECKIGLYLPENSPLFNEESFKRVDFIWADEITTAWIDKDKVALAHRLQKPFYAISPELIVQSIFNGNIEKRWQELIDAEVDGICTDNSDKFLEFLDR